MGNAGGKGLGNRAVIPLSILLRGKRKQKIKWELFMPEAASARTESKSQTPRPVPRPGRIPSSICSALVLLAENADWGHHKFLLSNLSEALSILLFISFICPQAALFFRGPLYLFPRFPPLCKLSTPAQLPSPSFFWSGVLASGRKQSASLPASRWTCVPSSVRGRQ